MTPMRTHLRPIVIAVLVLAAAGLARAQAPAPSAPAAAPAQAAPAPALPSPPPNYLYSADGRRDPFVNLLNRGADPRTGGVKRPEGAAGISVAELIVRGTVQSRGAWVAMVTGAEGKVYVVRPGDRLLDGTIRSVGADAVVIFQEVNDPLSLDKRREVRKLLRGGDEVK